jgi:hypothetical protein
VRTPKPLLPFLVDLLVIITFAAPTLSQNAVPLLINYQGDLRSPTTGEPVSDGSYDMAFRVYDVESGGAALWEGTHTAANSNPVVVANGIFSVILGSGTGNALDASLFEGADRWLEIEVAGEILSPRQRITSTAFSIVSQNSRLFDGRGLSDFIIQAQGLRLESNEISPNVIGGYLLNAVTDGVIGATVSGGGESGLENRVSDSFGTVGGGRNNEAGDDAGTVNDKPGATVGGGAWNIASGRGATVGGGLGNQVTADYATIAGGGRSTPADPLTGNRVTDDYGTIGGGGGNLAGNDNSDATDAQRATVGGGQANTASGPNSTVGGGYGNNATGPSATIAGGGQSSATQFAATVGGGASNNASGARSTIAGGGSNKASGAGAAVGGGDSNDASAANATIGGGYNNQASAKYATISGGGPSDEGDLNTNNRVTDNYGTIGGGGNNQAGDNAGTASDANFATVGGGHTNIAGAFSATVAGGGVNTANAPWATIGGGNYNKVTDDYGTVAGGSNNRAGDDAGTTQTARYATVGGGLSNEATGYCATVSGGLDNTAGWYSTAGGGQVNSATGDCATIAGGYWSTASGTCATVPGGGDCIAAGDYSFAAGWHARANHNGAFVWGDTQNVGTASTKDDEVTFRCHGGVRFLTGAAGANQMVSWAPGDSSWSFTSDRNLKENFVEIDSKEVLERVSRLPITEWNFKGYALRHIGPVAQDFQALFPLGGSDTTIDSGDLQGVSLAAIQGLHELLREKDGEISTLKKQNAELEARLTVVESLLKTLVGGPGAAK